MLQRTKTILIGVLVIAVCFLAVDSYLMRRETTASTHRMSSVMDEMLRAVRGEGPSTPFEAAHGFDGLAAGSPRIIGSWFSAAEPREVVIRVGDELKIQDFANRGVDVTERVARDGMVLMPDVGWVEVAGKTRVQVELELSQAYQQFYSSAPDVKVKVVE